MPAKKLFGGSEFEIWQLKLWSARECDPPGLPVVNATLSPDHLHAGSQARRLAPDLFSARNQMTRPGRAAGSGGRLSSRMSCRPAGQRNEPVGSRSAFSHRTEDLGLQCRAYRCKGMKRSPTPSSLAWRP